MLRLGTIVLGAGDVTRAVEFWCAALSYDARAFEGSPNDFTILLPPTVDGTPDGERIGTRLAVQRAETPADDQPRIHIDLVVDSAEEQKAEAERLCSLGATVPSWAGYGDDPDFIVLADPDGNRFCIVNAGHGSPHD